MINDVMECSHCGKPTVSIDEEGEEECLNPTCPGPPYDDSFLRQQERKQLGIGQ